MHVTVRKEEGVEKVFMDNTYVGYINNDVAHVFNEDNQAVWLHGVHTPYQIVEEYRRFHEHIFLIERLVELLELYAPHSITIEKAKAYLFRKKK